MCGFKISEHASLKPFNTLDLDIQAHYIAQVETSDELRHAVQFAGERELPLIVSGAGSNIFYAGDFPGVVIRVGLSGMSFEANPEGARVRVSAGENWADLVDRALSQDLYGLENLSAIPGTVGAAPIQNIGAYGSQLDEVLVSVEVLNRDTMELECLSRDECELSYRDSLFRRLPDRYVITSVEMQLSNRSRLNIDYPSLARELAGMGVVRPTGELIATAVKRVRARLLPDPSRLGNIGSFFKNPIVTSRLAESLHQRFPDLPVKEEREGRKISAAWMIDYCRLKGTRIGNAAVSSDHALILVNLGGASPADFLGLIELVRSRVADQFELTLDLEPRVVRF